MTKKSTITVDMTERDKELFKEWQDLLSFTSQRQMVEFTTRLGLMALELSASKPLDASGFANALYTVGSRFISAEFGRSGIVETIEGFKEWQKQRTELETSTVTRVLRQSG